MRTPFVLVITMVMLATACTSDPSGRDNCEPQEDPQGWSVARQWNEANLEAIRRDLPAPTVHARNLYHASAAMWDAWAAYDEDAAGVFVNETTSVKDVPAAREEAMSYAAYRVLEHRYLDSVGATETIPELDLLMASLCFDIDMTSTGGDSPAALGNRIASVIIAAGLEDGSNEAEAYAAEYDAVNPPLVVNESGTVLNDPNRWQPLQIDNMVSQNGILLDTGIQEFIDPHWGYVTGFALPPAPANGVPIDPGLPPRLGTQTDQVFKDDAVEVVGFSALLDPALETSVDSSPATL